LDGQHHVTGRRDSRICLKWGGSIIELIGIDDLTAVNLIKPEGFSRKIGAQKTTVFKHRLFVVTDV
jgi:hypothetical protein